MSQRKKITLKNKKILKTTKTPKTLKKHKVFKTLKRKKRTIKLITKKRKRTHPTVKKLGRMSRKELLKLLIKENLVKPNTKAPKKMLIDMLVTSKSNNINIIKTK